MLSSLGATDRHVRLVMVANGAVVGVLGTGIGAVIGFAIWIAYVPHLAASADHSVVWSNLPWWLIATTMVLAVATAVVASWRPAHAVTRIPVVAALSGRPAPTRAVRLSALPGSILLGIGLILLASSGGYDGGNTNDLLGGVAAVSAGLLLLTPITIASLGVVAHRAPIAVRIALRDLVRYRTRSAAALAASSFAILIAMFVTLIAAGRYADPVDYVGPNLSTSQLVVYSSNGNAGGPGPATPTMRSSPAELASRASAIAAALGSHDVLGLEAIDVVLVQQIPLHKARGNVGHIYLATPALLRHYGIDPSSIGPTTDLVTSRAGLAGASQVRLIQQEGDAQLANPKIQTFSGLPTDTAGPNLLVTPHAVQALNLRVVQEAWLIQAPQPLTSLQVGTARQMALAAGMTIETRNNEPAASEISNDATAAGIVLALGVLVMTVGLIRGEAAGDLRILAATGAGGLTRRGITSATAGALGLLGAVLGTVVAYLATAAFSWDQLTEWLGNTPVFDLLLVLVGLPTVAAAGGWLLAGRGPTRVRPGVVR
jgi:putative ABC transport system permease protein